MPFRCGWTRGAMSSALEADTAALSSGAPHFVTTGTWHRRASLALMLASGFAGLGYQIVWTQQCSLWLGHESAGVLAVVAAFFGGLALGALALGPRIEASRHPIRWYAGCEAIIGLWSLALAILIDRKSVV